MTPRDIAAWYLACVIVGIYAFIAIVAPWSVTVGMLFATSVIVALAVMIA